MLKGMYVLGTDVFDMIYGPEEQATIADRVQILGPQLTADAVRARPELLAEVEIMFSGWGALKLTEEMLAHAPRLKAVFYGAGSVKPLVTDAFWRRDIPLMSAWCANAVPVAEFTLAEIILSLKGAWRAAAQVRAQRAFPARKDPVAGCFRATVGLVSLGVIGRRVCELLRALDVTVLAYDPFATPDTARELGVTLASLDELFRRCDVVSLHTPWLKETEGMITGAHVSLLKPYATFINTARGAVVREAELIATLQTRPDLTALLDVTHPEPPAPDSPLYTLPNVVLTPHIAGSHGPECRRMGAYVLQDLDRFLRGEPMIWRVTREMAARMA